MDVKVLKKSYHIPREHKAFDGHFPHSPIFPAVAQIDLVLDLLREHFKGVVRTCNVKRGKFRAILVPDSDVVLELTLLKEGEARWSLSGQGQIYSMGDLLYSVKDRGSSVP